LLRLPSARKEAIRMKRTRFIWVLSLILLCLQAEPSIGQWLNEKRVVIRDLEYYMATDKAEYAQEEDIQMLCKITNLGSDSVTFTFGTTQIYDFYISDSSEIWRWSWGKYFLQVITEIILAPGDSTLALDEWDMNNAYGDTVLPGEYQVTGIYVYSLPFPPCPVSVEIGVNPSSVGERRDLALPSQFSIEQNYPNPFNPTTTIRYTIPDRDRERRPHRTTLRVYNVLGQLVRTLVDGEQAPGYYSVRWDGRNSSGQELPSGVYIYRIQAGGYVQARRMILLK